MSPKRWTTSVSIKSQIQIPNIYIVLLKYIISNSRSLSVSRYFTPPYMEKFCLSLNTSLFNLQQSVKSGSEWFYEDQFLVLYNIQEYIAGCGLRASPPLRAPLSLLIMAHHSDVAYYRPCRRCVEVWRVYQEVYRLVFPATPHFLHIPLLLHTPTLTSSLDKPTAVKGRNKMASFYFQITNSYLKL